jgi:hypothetical protein
VLLPACRSCNAELDRRFEQPAKEHLRRLFHSRGKTSLVNPELELVSLWLLKTLLLLAHPAALYSDPLVDDKAIRWGDSEVPPRAYYSWLTDRTAPPEGLSLWVFLADEDAAEDSEPIYKLPLPRVTADDEILEFTCFQVTFHGLHLTLVFHPGWRIEHPLESNGTAIRLWPDPPHEADLSRLPLLPRRTVSWFRCHVTLRPGMLGSDRLPPLSHSGLPFALLPDVHRFASRWGM